jgi:hypothetical protein
MENQARGGGWPRGACPNSSEPMEIIVSELGKAPKVPRSIQADNLKPSIFRFLIAASLVTSVAPGASAWAAIMMSNAPALRETPGTDADPRMGFSGCFVPRMN